MTIHDLIGALKTAQTMEKRLEALTRVGKVELRSDSGPFRWVCECQFEKTDWESPTCKRDEVFTLVGLGNEPWVAVGETLHAAVRYFERSVP